MKGFIYLLENQKNQRYLGSTVDADTRLEEHNKNLNSSTRNKGPWKIIMNWEFETIEEARQAEYWVKRMKRKLTVENISELIHIFKHRN